MYASVLLIAGTFLIGAIIAHFYRPGSGFLGFGHIMVGRSHKTGQVSKNAQKGYVSLTGASRRKVRQVRFNRPEDGVRKPWGW